ncbi:low affinity immunoglobulin epsilon Fc receptor [Macrotis lagotis]|uniref:low affinity immunoglobulin epsilon Fc receptor n=1 Tax=Macrotis lagotis TaxID=92651 RepID=UPI003D684FB4
MEAKWNGSSDQVEFSRMSPRSQGFTKLPGQKTCEKNTLLLIFVLLISMVLWGTVLYLFLNQAKDLKTLQKSCVNQNDSGIVTIIRQLEMDQKYFKNNVSQCSKTLNQLQKDQTTLKSKDSQVSQQLDSLEKDKTTFKSQVINQMNDVTQAQEKLQEEMEKLWIEFQSLKGTECTNCPEDWELFQKKCYFFGKEPKTWPQAKYACISLQGRLVSIKSREEQNFLTQKANKKGSWIGLRDLDVEGKFIWMDGSSLNYTYWSPGEPNNLGQGEDCVAMRASNGRWNDAYCRGHQESWICEKLVTC